MSWDIEAAFSSGHGLRTAGCKVHPLLALQMEQLTTVRQEHDFWSVFFRSWMYFLQGKQLCGCLQQTCCQNKVAPNPPRVFTLLSSRDVNYKTTTAWPPCLPSFLTLRFVF